SAPLENPMHADSIERFREWERLGSAQGQHIHLVSTRCKRGGITHHTIVVLIERMRDHADPAAPSWDRWLELPRKVREVRRQRLPLRVAVAAPHVVQEFDVVTDR